MKFLFIEKKTLSTMDAMEIEHGFHALDTTLRFSWNHIKSIVETKFREQSDVRPNCSLSLDWFLTLVKWDSLANPSTWNTEYTRIYFLYNWALWSYDRATITTIVSLVECYTMDNPYDCRQMYNEYLDHCISRAFDDQSDDIINIELITYA